MEDLEQQVLREDTRNCSQMVRRNGFKSRKERPQEEEGADQKEEISIQEGEVLVANLRERRGESRRGRSESRKERAQEEGQIR